MSFNIFIGMEEGQRLEPARCPNVSIKLPVVKSFLGVPHVKMFPGIDCAAVPDLVLSC